MIHSIIQTRLFRRFVCVSYVVHLPRHLVVFERIVSVHYVDFTVVFVLMRGIVWFKSRHMISLLSRVCDSSVFANVLIAQVAVW